MKSKKGLLFIVLLLLLAGGLYWQFIYKKKSKPAPKAKAPVEKAEQERPLAPPKPAAEPASPETLPGKTPPPPQPGLPEGAPEGAQLPEGGPPPPPPDASEGGIPKAQPGTAETQPLIQIDLEDSMRLAEGTTFYMEEAKVDYGGKRSLKYQWELISGPEEKIEIQGKNELKALITLGNLEQPQDFVLGLKVTDGLTESIQQIKITGFPAKLQGVSRTGGAFTQVQHMGDKWVILRGQTLEIRNKDLKTIAQIPVETGVKNYFTTVDKTGQGSLFVQDPKGSWALYRYDPLEEFKVTRLPMMGNKIRKVVPFELNGDPYIFALLEKSVELWNLKDPKRPRLKSSLRTQLKDPMYLSFLGRNLFVADEDNIETIEFSTGQPVASVASGGSITALQTYALDDKQYLMAAIGKDRTAKQRQDYGLRLFEIGSGGRLGQERRVAIGEGAAVESAYVIPGTQQAMVKLLKEGQLNLGLYDLQKEKLLPLNFDKKPEFISIADLATGKIDGTPVALIADGNQLRVLSFQGEGTPPQSFQVKETQAFPGLLRAIWIISDAEGQNIWVGDEGSTSGGAIARLEGPQLKVLSSTNVSGMVPLAAAGDRNQNLVGVLNLVGDPKNLPMDQAEGSLSLFALDATDPGKSSKVFLGQKTAEGELRPLGLDLGLPAAPEAPKSKAKEKSTDEADPSNEAPKAPASGTLLGVAISRVSGALGGAGLGLFTKGRDQSNEAFLQQDLSGMMDLVPLPAARDVALTQDGKGAFLASGVDGVIGVQLQDKNPVARMSLGTKDWFADRVQLAHNGTFLLASFLNPGSRQVILKIFGIGENMQMQEYTTLTGLMAIETVEGLRAPGMALTSDDLYLFFPKAGKRLVVMNLSNPAKPFEITSLELMGEIRDVSLAAKFKKVLVALGSLGVVQLEFGF